MNLPSFCHRMKGASPCLSFSSKTFFFSVFYILFFIPLQAAIIPVTNLNDSGAGSLRQAVIDAAPTGDQISFQVNGLITLTSGQINISKSLDFDGTSVDIAISGNNSSRIFEIFNGNTVNFNSITFQNGGFTAGFGGAISSAADLSFINCNFNDNNGGNGGALASFGSLYMINCHFSGNTSSSQAGACDLQGTSTLVNCSFFNNTAGSLGGALIPGLADTYVNCTFAFNTANNASGGGGIWNASGSNLTLQNCIVFGNVAPSNADIRNDATLIASHNLIGDFSGTGLTIGTDNNITGTPTFTNAPFGDLTLDDGSLGINLGNNAFLPTDINDGDGDLNVGEIIDFDQNLNSRITTCYVDLGAFENQNGGFVVTNTNDSGAGSLRNAVECADATPGGQIISFDIPGAGVQTISYLTRYDINDAETIIDGSTQPGYADTPLIFLDGSNSSGNTSIFINATNTEIYGLNLQNSSGDGIFISANGSNSILGDSNRGNIITNNNNQQVFIDNADNCIIQGNLIGIDENNVGNTLTTLAILCQTDANNTQIDNNVIGASSLNGLTLIDIRVNSNSTFITNNFIGTTPNGGGFGAPAGISLFGGENAVILNNTIANNDVGVEVFTSFNDIYQNNFVCNNQKAIDLNGTGNNNRPAPIITSATTSEIAGTALYDATFAFVEIYLQDNSNCTGAACQGSYSGFAAIQPDGTWSLTTPTFNSGDVVTAMLSFSDDPNTNIESSELSACATVTDPCNPDNTPPVFANIPADVTIDCLDPFPVNTLTASDFCDGDLTGQIQSIGLALPVNCSDGTTFDVFTTDYFVTDANNNAATPFTWTITRVDGTPPVWDDPSLSVTVVGECGVDDIQTLLNANLPTGTDGCGIAVVTEIGMAALSGCPPNPSNSIIEVYTFQVADECGNVNPDTYDVTIQLLDTQAPVFSNIPPDLTLECTDAIPVPPTPTAIDACDGDLSSAIQTSITLTPFNCANNINRTETYVYTVMDGCGNMATSPPVTYTFIDTDPPVFLNIPLDLTIECDDQILFPPLPDVFDLCDGGISSANIQVNSTTIPLNCSNNQVRQEIFTFDVMDACGNAASTVSVTYTYEDTTPPFFNENLPQDVVLSCGDPLPNIPTLTATDFCADHSVATVFFEEIGSFDPTQCVNGQTITRTWTATDACGNETPHTQTISFNDDTENPIFPFIDPSTLTINTDPGACSAFVSFTVPDATDGCGIAPFGAYSNNSPFADDNNSQSLDGTYIIGTYPVEFTVTDLCGNTGTTTVTIIVLDGEDPVLQGVPADVTISCNDPYPDLPTVTVSDNCDDNPSLSIIPPAVFNGCNPAPSQILDVYTFIGEDAAGNQTTAFWNITIVNDLVVDLGPDVAICSGSATLDAGIPNATYEWSNGATTQTIDVTTADTYTVTVTGGNGCCNFDEIIVTTGTAPDATATGGTLDCNNSSVQLMGSSTTANPAFAWTGPNGFTSNEQNPTASVAGTYTLIVTSQAGCTGSDVTQVATDGDVPDVLTSDATLDCNNASVQLMGGSTTPNPIFTWTGPNGFTSNEQNPTVSDVGTYTLTVTAENGCTAFDEAMVDQDLSEPDAMATGGALNCSNASVQLMGSSTTPNPAFAWTGPNGFTSNEQNPTVSEAGTYTLTVTGQNGCTASDPTTVNEDLVEPDAMATGGTLDCSNASVQLMGSSTTPNPAFEWAGPNGFTSNEQNPTVSEAGTYTLTITGQNGCTASDPTTVNEDLVEPDAMAIGGTLDCSNTSVQLMGSSTTPNPAFEWAGPNGFTSNEQNPTVSEAGIYTLTVTGQNGCTASDPTTVNEDLVEPDAMATGGTLDCSNASVQLMGNSTTPNPAYEWTGPNGFTSNEQNPTVSIAGTYLLTVTAQNGCTETAQATVDSDGDVPTVSTMGGDIDCTNSDVTLMGNFDVVNLTFGWTGPNGFTSTEQNPTVSEAGTYTLTVTAQNGCTAFDDAIVNEDTATPDATTADAVIDCDNTSVQLMGNSTTANPSFGWTGPNGFTSNEQNPTVSDAGTYTLTVTGQNGCTSTSTANVTSDGDLPDVSATGGTLDCTTTEVQLMGNSNTPNVIFAWTGPNGFTSNEQNPFVSETGDYTLTVTTSTGCAASAIAMVSGDSDLPDVMATGGTLDCNTTQIQLMGSSNTPGVTFAWTGPNGFSSNEQNPFVSETGDYTLTVTASSGCAASATAIVASNGATTPAAAFTFTNSGLDVAFSDASTGTPIAWSWDFNDLGNTSTEQNPSYTFSADGTYEVCLTVTNDCGTNESCQMVSVSTAMVDEVIFNIGTETGISGNIINIPVTVENFTNIISFQKSLHVADPTKAKFVGSDNYNLENLDDTDFLLISDETMTVVWFNNEGITVENGTLIYELEVELLSNEEECVTIFIDGIPTTIEVGQVQNGAIVPVPSSSTDGEACILGRVDISGQITRENGNPLADVTVDCTNQTAVLTDVDGNYIFEDLEVGLDYTVTPSRDFEYLDGVSAIDLAIIFQHILGTIPLNSPYKVVAADVDISGSVNGADLLIIQQLLQSAITAYPDFNPWRFVDAKYVFADVPGAAGEAFDEDIFFPMLDRDTIENDFIAMKLGDVNESAMGMIEPLVGDLNFEISESIGPDYTLINFHADDFTEILAYQFDILFNTNEMEFLEVVPGQLAGISPDKFGQTFLQNGILTALWYDTNGNIEGTSIADGAILFSLKFKNDAPHLALEDRIQTGSNSLPSNGFTKDREALTIQTTYLETVTSVTETLAPTIRLYEAQPNPFIAKTTLSFDLSKEEKVTIEIFDAAGKILQRIEDNFKAGLNQITIDGVDLSGKGLYYYTFKTDGFYEVKKLIYQ